MSPISIYIHIPFCERKCFYCAFNSFCATNAVKETYINLLCRELASRKILRPVKTIYIGGGTPSTLSSAQIEKIIETLKQNYNLENLQEFTIEVNPNSLNEELLKTYKRLGINRISMGVQSLNSKSLQKIGRLHTPKEAVEKLKLASKYIENISADLIVGLEKQTGAQITKDVKKLLKSNIKHISCYLLEIYENAPIYKLIEEKSYIPLSDKRTINVFNKLASTLQKKGFERYEISNFSKPRFESEHNLNYWQRGEYLGFGISAHSFIDGKRTQNAENIENYSKGVRSVEVLSKQEEIEEIVMLGLRCRLGVDLTVLKSLGYDLTKNKFFEEYLNSGVISIENERLVKLNPKFYHISNTIICNLLP